MIFTNNKMAKFDLETEGQVEGGENGTECIRLKMFESILVNFVSSEF